MLLASGFVTVPPCPGIIMFPLIVGKDGMLMWLPSTPIRKLLVGSPPSPHAPVVSGVVHTDWSPKPTPSAGVMTIPTPLTRSNTRAQPPRKTVLRSPKTLPSKPPVKDGFQASPTRGPRLV